MNSEDNSREIIPGYASIEQFTKDGFTVLTEAIRNSNALPSGRDWNFYNTHDSFVNFMNDKGNQILNSINFELRKYEIDGNIKSRSIEDKMELIVEANDVILEKVANNIDEMNGIKKNFIDPVIIQTVSAELPVNGSWNRINKASFSVGSLNSDAGSQGSSSKSIRLLAGKNIIRPQKFFKDKIDNSNKYPWMPRIKEKPNSLKPLAIFLEETENGEEYSHPYEFELERFEPSYVQLQESIPIKPKPISETPLIEVSTEEQLQDLLNDLYGQKEFAVDLEHHSYRSFLGITCLMQISTVEKDYLIDTLALRDKLHILNEVFTKPSIVKIFHGADSDILWLQRDLSLYVVNMFDTHQAAKQLEYSGRSLAFLLQKFCNFMPNKHFQLADWRIRPLPDELKMYAREDTHYLIYIFHMMKNELLKRGNRNDKILRSVIHNSTEICKRRFLKPILKEDSHLDFYRKCKRLFDNRQLFALKGLYKWRDQISREEDESTGYVLPNHMLLQISAALPREMQGILACCNPIPPLVRANLLELHKIILQAREQSVERLILKEDNRGRGSVKQLAKINVDSPLHCPHDLTKTAEFRDDLDTLLKNSTNQIICNITKLEIEKSHADVSMFGDTDDELHNKVENETIKKLKNLKFLGPYERYKLVKPFIKEEEEEKAATDRLESQLIKNRTATEMLDEKVVAKIETPEETVIVDNTESIATLHEHFVNMVNQIPQILPQNKQSNQSLIAMGGSRKRKFVEYEQDNYCDDIDLNTPRPNLYKNPKRKFNQAGFQNTDNEAGPTKKGKYVPPRKQKQKRKQKNENPNQNQNNKQVNYTPKKNKNKQKNKNAQQTNYQNQQNLNVNEQQNVNNQQNRNVNNPQRQNKKNPQKQNKNNQQNQHQNVGNRNKNSRRNRYKAKQEAAMKQEQNFTPYDYSAVDYRQFQGGARSAFQNNKFKTNFKARGKNKSPGKNNSQSFSHHKNQ